MTLQELVSAQKVFEKLSQKEMKIQLAYKIMKFLKEAKKDVDFYREKCKEIIEKYSIKENGKIKQEGGNIYIQPDKQNEFQNEFDELKNLEVSAPEINFNVGEFQDLQVTAIDLLAIEQFLINN